MTYPLKKILSTLILWLSFAAPVCSQILPEKGVPWLANYTPTEYHDQGKIWNIQTAPNGIVYMAADGGLLEFDGNVWKSYKGSSGFTRSVLVVSDSLIYSGSDLDFGVWRRTKTRNFEYTSLYPFREEAQDVSEEFWHITRIGGNIVFISARNMYLQTSDQLVKIPAPSRFTGHFWHKDSLYLTDADQGLFLFEDFSLRKVFDYPEGHRFEMAGIFENTDGLVLVTRNAGLFQYVGGTFSRLESSLSDQLQAAKVFCFEKIGDHYVAFGTVLKGLYIAGTDGEIVHHVNKQKGLPSNTVLALHFSRNGKLWLGMDYGVSSLNLLSKYTYFFDYRGDFGTGYTALLKDKSFLLGTNQGLYRTGWDALNSHLEYFRLSIVPGTEGQVWTLQQADQEVLMGHDKGLFLVGDHRIEKLDDQEGVWTILPYKDALLTGNYNGISVFRKRNNRWTLIKKMGLIRGSCNQILIEKENILWVNIPNFGIIRALLNDDLEPEERLIFPEVTFRGNHPYLHRQGSNIQVLTDTFQYTYQGESAQFKSDILHVEELKPKGLLAGIYQPVALNPEYEFFPVYNGFALQYLGHDDAFLRPLPVLTLRKMDAFRNQERIALHPGARVPFSFNNLRMEYIVANQENVLYRYRIDDQEEYTPWGPEHSFVVSGLRYGDHLCEIQAKHRGILSETVTFPFRIAAPWHRSWYAFFLYALLLSLILWSVRGSQVRALKKQKKEMLIREKKAMRERAAKHRLEIKRLRQEKLEVENEQLRQQMKHKTIELANKARDNEEKNRLILTLKEQCEKAMKNPSLSKQKLSEMQRILTSYLNVDDKTFEIQMDELHHDFFRKLKERFPGLSNHDLRLCAYLKIGLNSKEIADILNIQPSSSYISRSRLRKKLNLLPDENLYDFLNDPGLQGDHNDAHS